MRAWGRAVIGPAIAIFIPVAGCCGGAPCPSNQLGIEADGRCITSIDSSCPHGFWPCDDAGNRYSYAWVFPGDDAGSPSVCDVAVQLDDGTSVALSVRFTPYNQSCCGLSYQVDPPYLSLTAPADGGVAPFDATVADAGDF